MQIEDGKIIYRKGFRKLEKPIKDIVWAYVQQEDVTGKLCCGSACFPIGRLIVIDKKGEVERFQYDGLSEPKRLLKILEEQNPEITVGYTAENRAKFGLE